MAWPQEKSKMLNRDELANLAPVAFKVLKSFRLQCRYELLTGTLPAYLDKTQCRSLLQQIWKHLITEQQETVEGTLYKNPSSLYSLPYHSCGSSAQHCTPGAYSLLLVHTYNLRHIHSALGSTPNF